MKHRLVKMAFELENAARKVVEGQTSPIYAIDQMSDGCKKARKAETTVRFQSEVEREFSFPTTLPEGIQWVRPRILIHHDELDQ